MTPYVSANARQPIREPWTIERLLEQRAVALGMALENPTAGTYQSHLNSYLNFCHTHNLPINPTTDTLSFFIVYMSAFIKPQSVGAYLSGIVSTLKPHFPDVRKNRALALVSRTLTGCVKMRGSATARKSPLTGSDLRQLLTLYGSSSNYDDLLFLAITFIGFHGLLCLGELVMNDNPHYQSSRKAVKRHTVSFHDNPCHFSFVLPMHKADHLYEGSTIVIEQQDSDLDPAAIFQRYLHSRDQLHCWHPLLWLQEAGLPPTRSWYIQRLRHHFSGDFGGHSLRSGGATALALANTPANHIQLAGRWSSDTFQIYIRKHPILLNAIVSGKASFDQERHNSHGLPSSSS
jgi:hypothetical protein